MTPTSLQTEALAALSRAAELVRFQDTCSIDLAEAGRWIEQAAVEMATAGIPDRAARECREAVAIAGQYVISLAYLLGARESAEGAGSVRALIDLRLLAVPQATRSLRVETGAAIAVARELTEAWRRAG